MEITDSRAREVVVYCYRNGFTVIIVLVYFDIGVIKRERFNDLAIRQISSTILTYAILPPAYPSMHCVVLEFSKDSGIIFPRFLYKSGANLQKSKMVELIGNCFFRMG